MGCPFCNSNQIVDSKLPNNFFNDKTFDFFTCANCSLVYINPIPNADDLEKMYPPSYQGAISLDKMDIRKKLPGLRFTYKEQLDIINEKTNDRILDYGCGTGHFIYNALQEGTTVDGVEFSSIVIEQLRNKMPKNKFYTINEFNAISHKYKIIRLSNVLEHFTSPVEEFRKLLEKLEVGGLVIVEGPLEMNISLVNFFKWNYLKVRKMINSSYYTNHHPTHIFFSNKKNQLNFFKKFELKTLEYYAKENTWPYPEKIKDAKTVGLLFKYMIGKLSIFLSLIIPNYGNTFLYVGKK